MTSPDEEFDDFLRKRRPLFGRPADLEPPLELDRAVLRQAREAIEGARPQRIFRTPSWGMPVALAATLVLGFTIILRVGKPDVVKQPEVTVQNVARRVEMPAVAAPPAAPAEVADAGTAAGATALDAQADDSGAVVVDLGAPSVKSQASLPRAADRLARPVEQLSAAESRTAAGTEPRTAESAAAGAAPRPPYRRDSKSWLAEIERLRASGETGRADAELAEYKREHRAYAGAPDR
jgi:hypothetical protein